MNPHISSTQRRHDRLALEVERVTGRATSDWFQLLDRSQLRTQGVVPAIQYLRDREGLPHQLASVLAWSYFHPSTLPCAIVRRLDPRYATREHPSEIRSEPGKPPAKRRPGPRPARAAKRKRR